MATCGRTSLAAVVTVVCGGTANDGTPVEVTSELALPVTDVVDGVVAVGGGNRVGGVLTPLNDGPVGADVMVTGDVIVTPFDAVVTELVTDGLTGFVIVTAEVAATALVPLNCAATGNDVNVAPLKESPTTATGTFELMNNNPEMPRRKFGSPLNSSVTKSDTCCCGPRLRVRVATTAPC